MPQQFSNRARPAWLIPLRWLALIGQCSTIAAAYWLGWPIELKPIVFFLSVEAITNVIAAYIIRNGDIKPRRDRWLLIGMLLVDSACLTGLLAASGGWANPFYAFYVVHVLLAAVLLRPTGLALITGASVIGYMTLGFITLQSIDYTDLYGSGFSGPGGAISFATGRRLAFVVVLLAVTLIATYLSRAVYRAQRELQRVRRKKAEQRSLEMVASLAAGAAHELATPLGAIAIAAEELEDTWDMERGEEGLDDVRLIRSQIVRCRTLLHRLATTTGQSTGELPVLKEIGPWLQSTVELLPPALLERVQVFVEPQDLSWRLASVALSDLVLTLVRNALDADKSGAPVQVRARLVAHKGDSGPAGETGLEISVRDRGPGIDPELVDRIYDPFFTTKPAGEGMGLGLYLGRTVINALNGQFYHHSSAGGGTTFIIWLPALRV